MAELGDSNAIICVKRVLNLERWKLFASRYMEDGKSGVSGN